MALKDWKKGRKGFIIHKPSENKSFAEKRYINIGEIGMNKRNGYYVFIATGTNRKAIQKEFKTKTQALAYAKAYMRKH